METTEYNEHKKVCIKLLEKYTKCISSNNTNCNTFSEIYNTQLYNSSITTNIHKCYGYLYILEKWCMNPDVNIPKKW